VFQQQFNPKARTTALDNVAALIHAGLNTADRREKPKQLEEMGLVTGWITARQSLAVSSSGCH
jgi:hypothetical protein